MERRKDATGAASMGCGTGISEIVQRRRRQMQKCRQVLPPDFVHGEVAVGEVYEVLGQQWAEQAVFVVETPRVVTVAYFDDYFLVVEQWSPDTASEWEQWWRQRSGGRRVVAMQLAEESRLDGDVSVNIDVDRRRLTRLEQGVLGVTRDGLMGIDDGESELYCRGEIDVLSLVTLTSRLAELRDGAAK